VGDEGVNGARGGRRWGRGRGRGERVVEEEIRAGGKRGVGLEGDRGRAGGGKREEEQKG